MPPEEENKSLAGKTPGDASLPSGRNYERLFQETCARDWANNLPKRPNILICGYTGSGKTSLIRAVCGKDLVPEERIGSGAPVTGGYDCYENEHIRLWDSRGLELGMKEEDFIRQTRSFIRERQMDPDVDSHIHLVWYTIQGCGARVTDCDLNLIRHIFDPADEIVVLTKRDITRPAQLEAMRARLTGAGVPDRRIIACSDEESGSEGCLDLVRLSCELLPDAYRDAFAEAQKLDLELKIERIRAKSFRAKAIVSAAVSAAAAVGVTPIPVADSSVLVPIQAAMIGSLAALYNLREAALKEALLPFLARGAGVFAASSLLKLLPGLGNGINAAVAASLTGAMGLYVRNTFEKIAIARVRGEKTSVIEFDWKAFTLCYDLLRSSGAKK